MHMNYCIVKHDYLADKLVLILRDLMHFSLQYGNNATVQKFVVV